MAEEIKIESAEVNAQADENLKKFFAELQSNDELQKYFADAIEGLDEDAAVAKIAEILKSAENISNDAAAPSPKRELDEESMESVSGGVVPVIIGAALKAYTIYETCKTVVDVVKAGKEIYDTYQAEKQKAEEAAFMSGGINVTGNFNNDNRGGKQMNVQMGDNVNSSSGNSM